MSTTTHPVEREALRAWLDEHRDDVVGYARDSGYCPVARYLVTDRGCSAVVVYGSGIDLSPASVVGQVFVHPNWLRAFIKHIDAEFNSSNRVTGAAALEILDEIETT